LKLASFEAIVRAFAQAQVRYLDNIQQPAGEPLQLLSCGQLQGYQRKAGSE
jgi:hypothetical protein